MAKLAIASTTEELRHPFETWWLCEGTQDHVPPRDVKMLAVLGLVYAVFQTSAQAIADHLDMPPREVEWMLLQLEQGGYVERGSTRE